jgi:hypothetical protein
MLNLAFKESYLEERTSRAVAKYRQMQNIKGHKLEKLTIIGYSRKRKDRHMWYARCICGNMIEVSGVMFRIGHTKSCGCIRIKDYTGRKFNSLTVIEMVGQNKKGAALWQCICDCGEIVVVPSGSLVSGTVKTCGCSKKSQYGKYIRTPELKTWNAINYRCNNPKCLDYEYYGGRGIRVEWESFDDFIRDMGDRPSSYHTIDRLDVNGNYSKDNCVWATRQEQGRNRRATRSKTGYAGVYERPGGTYLVGIFVDKNTKLTKVGIYDSLEDAVRARQDAELKYWGHTYTQYQFTTTTSI